MSQNLIFDADYPREILIKEQGRRFPEGIAFLRNWHFEDAARWSRAQAASLAVERAMFPVASELLVDVRVFNASKDNPKTVTVESVGNAPRHYVFSTSHTQQIIVATPQFDEVSPRAELVFHVDKLESPYELGLSNDDRLLGISIRAMSVYERRPAFRLDQSATEDLAVHLISGWSTPEPNGTWSIAAVAEIGLEHRHIRNASGIDLAFGVMPRLATNPPLDVRISCNSREIQCLSFASGGDHITRVMFNEVDLMGEDQRIRIEMENLISPAELGLSTDGRRLGICLKRVDPVCPHVNATLPSNNRADVKSAKTRTRRTSRAAALRRV